MTGEAQITEESLSDVPYNPFDEEITFESKAKPQEFPPYLGIIVHDNQEYSSFKQEDGETKTQHQWHYVIRPVRSPASKGWHGFANWSRRENTTMMRLLADFAEILGTTHPKTGAALRPGKGELVGLVAWFQNKSYDFGPKMSPGKPRPVPVRAATAAEWAEAETLPAYVTESGADAEQAPVTSFTDEQLAYAARMYDGNTHKVVIKTSTLNRDLDPTLAAGIRSGALLNELIARGVVEKTDGDVIRALVTNEAPF